ncbi:MAG: hypothetical protein ACREJW_03885 [Candidatus Methylomirabilales bacterium]
MGAIPKKFNWWYDAIIDWMLANPDKALVDCARDLGRHVEYVRIIVRSDLFQTKYQERRAELNARMNLAIIDRASRVGVRAMDIMIERMEDTPERIPLDALVSMADKTLHHLGYGQPRAAPGIQATQVNVNLSVGREVLEEARRKMREIEGAPLEPSKPLIEEAVNE